MKILKNYSKLIESKSYKFQLPKEKHGSDFTFKHSKLFGFVKKSLRTGNSLSVSHNSA